MATKTIVDMFYDTTGYDDSETTSGDYISPSDVRDTYIEMATDLFNNITTQSISLVWTGSGASTSGGTLDDKIIAELAGMFADMTFDVFHINPETGERVNRHQETALNLLRMAYGVRTRDGTVLLPRIHKTEKASGTLVANENKS